MEKPFDHLQTALTAGATSRPPQHARTEADKRRACPPSATDEELARWEDDGGAAVEREREE
jgi:hypothetical protein